MFGVGLEEDEICDGFGGRVGGMAYGVWYDIWIFWGGKVIRKGDLRGRNQIEESVTV